MKLFSALLTAASVSLLGTAVNASTILASWSTWTDSGDDVIDADFVETGFSASIDYFGARINSGFGSNDGTFGTLAGATTASGGLLVRNTQASNILTLTLTNNTASAYSIDSLNFDFLARTNGTYNGFTGFDVVYTSGGLGDADTSVGSASGLTPLNVASTYDYLDYDFTLSDNLTDVVLGAGESAVFTITFDGQTHNDISSGFDNVAFIGTAVIPEPSTYALPRAWSSDDSSPSLVASRLCYTLC